MNTLQQYRDAESTLKQQLADVREAMNADPVGTNRLSEVISLLGDRPDVFRALDRGTQDSVIRMASLGFAHCVSGAVESLLMSRGDL